MSAKKKSGRPAMDPLRKKVRLTVTVDPVVLEEADASATKRGSSLSNFVEIALIAEIAKTKREFAKLGKLGGGPSTSLEAVPDNVIAYDEIPLFHAAAGSPAPSDQDTHIPSHNPGKGRIAVQLHGDSMAPTYIDGQIVILRSRGSLRPTSVKKGEIYLFDNRGELTLKEYNTRIATPSEIESGISYVSPRDGKTKVRVLRPLNRDYPEIVIGDEIDWIGWLDKSDNR